MRFALRSFAFALVGTLSLACGTSQQGPGPSSVAGAAGTAAAAAGTAAGGAGVGGSSVGTSGSSTGGSAGAVGGAGGSDTAGGGGGGGSGGRGAGSGGAGGGGAGGGAGVGGGAGAAGAAGGAGAPSVDHNAPGVIVVVGSSTAAGTGPKDPKNAWVERYRTFLSTEFKNFQLINLAVGGYTTWNEQPDDFVPPQGRPAPDKAHNISAALSKNPGAIVINLPGNDTASNTTLQEQMDNFGRMTDLATKAGVPVWVATTQPRNFTEQAQLMLQMQVRDAITTKYADHALDFWNPFAAADGTIKPMYNSGDGIHMNDDAHALLAQKVIDAKLPEAILSKH